MDHDQEYGDQRRERLVRLLRALAARIDALTDDDEMLSAGPELMRLMGDARSELFHYEVRCTYDTPEIARNRRIVEAAKRRPLDLPGEFPFDPDEREDDLPWQE